jgi:hypothetical protein
MALSTSGTRLSAKNSTILPLSKKNDAPHQYEIPFKSIVTKVTSLPE